MLLYTSRKSAPPVNGLQNAIFFSGLFSVIIFAGSSAMLELRKAVGVSLFVAEGGGKWNIQ